MLGLLLDLLALTGGTVHSLVPGEAPRVADVLVRDGRIEAVAADLEVPEGARRVDCTGLHVVPGLVDAMIGFDADHDPLYLDAGITLVRDVGHDRARIFQLRRPEQRDAGPGPALLTAGVGLDGDPPATPEAVPVADAAAADQVVEMLEGSVDFLAIQSGLGEEAWLRLIELGQGRDLGVWGPVPHGHSVQRVAEAGQTGIFFLDGFLPEGVEWSFVQPGAFEKGIAALVEAGTCVVPVLGGTAYRLRDPTSSTDLMRRLSPHYEAWWLEELDRRSRVMADESYLEIGRATIEKQMALVRRLNEAGVILVPGSAAPHPWLAPGVALHDELALWHEAGIPAADVLARATRDAAVALGQGEERGTVEAGKIADLLLVAGNPLDELAVLRHPVAVVLRGRLVEREELDAAVQAETERQAAARAKAARPIPVDPPDLPEGVVLASGVLQTRARGLPVSAESWAVVDLGEGRRAYCSRMLTPGGELFPDAELEVRQVTQADRLVEFDLGLHQAEHELTARGTWTAQTMRVERRMDGAFLENHVSRTRPAAVQLGSVTSLLIYADTREAGPLPVLELLEGLEPRDSTWELQRDDEHRELFVRTPTGGMAWRMAPEGGVEIWETWVGENLSRALPLADGDEAAEPGEPADAGGAPEVEAAEASADKTPPGEGPGSGTGGGAGGGTSDGGR